jgi:hypothetical protein
LTRRSARPAAWLLIVLAIFTALVLSTSGPPPPTPNPRGTFAFGALGDAPDYPWEDWRYPLVLQDMDGNDLTFSIHVGDTFWRPCSDDRYERSLRWFNGLKHPLLYVPGDNEWADCWTEQEGGFNPRDRLAHLRADQAPFKPLLDRFEDEAVAFKKPVLLIHGNRTNSKLTAR